jgi:hypothetical protein
MDELLRQLEIYKIECNSYGNNHICQQFINNIYKFYDQYKCMLPHNIFKKFLQLSDNCHRYLSISVQQILLKQIEFCTNKNEFIQIINIIKNKKFIDNDQVIINKISTYNNEYFNIFIENKYDNISLKFKLYRPSYGSADCELEPNTSNLCNIIDNININTNITDQNKNRLYVYSIYILYSIIKYNKFIENNYYSKKINDTYINKIIKFKDFLNNKDFKPDINVV